MMSETEAVAKAPTQVFDSRSIVAFATAMGRMPRPPEQCDLYFWEEEDKTPNGVAVVPRVYEQVNRQMNNFIKRAAWQAPSHLLPSGSAPRYIRMEVVPEGVKVTHYLGFYGTTIIGLLGMPKGKNSISPKIEYVTASDESEEKFVEKILFYLTQQ
jgi:hypothetical protein